MAADMLESGGWTTTMNLVNEIRGNPYRAPWRTCESMANCLGTGDSSLIFNSRKSGLRWETICPVSGILGFLGGGSPWASSYSIIVFLPAFLPLAFSRCHLAWDVTGIPLASASPSVQADMSGELPLRWREARQPCLTGQLTHSVRGVRFSNSPLWDTSMITLSCSILHPCLCFLIPFPPFPSDKCFCFNSGFLLHESHQFLVSTPAGITET